MKVIVESVGFQLVFKDHDDLSNTILQLLELKRERVSNKDKSWPALLGVTAKTPLTPEEAQTRSRWWRWKLGDPDHFHE